MSRQWVGFKSPCESDLVERNLAGGGPLAKPRRDKLVVKMCERPEREETDEARAGVAQLIHAQQLLEA
eukprot:558666-Prymnesium_polylepis.1